VPLQVGLALRIVRRARVLAAVDLDDQPGIHTGEIRDIGRNRVLAAESGAALLPVTQDRPEALLGLGRLTARLARLVT
jgi:hypothetical protein